MAETSYIIQNGRRLNLKDSTARKSIGSCDELETTTKHCLVDAINELNEKIESGGGGGGTGADGEDGVTFIPSVSEDGIISWTNDGGLDNPDPVNIKGADGEAGYTPVKGVDYFDGADGQDGQDGVSVTHSWSGTTLTVTSASGTSSADLKGADGSPGADGQDATINGVNALTVEAGAGIEVSQDGSALTIRTALGLSIVDGKLCITYESGV